MVLKLAMYSTYDSDISKFYKPVLIIVTVLITMKFKKFPSLCLILETKVAKILIEVRFFKSLASNIERMIGITLIE